MPRIFAGELERFVSDTLTAAGASPEATELTSSCLVAANLRGVDSHGVGLLPVYVEQLQSGDMDGTANGRVLSERGACLLFEAENGMGQVAAAQCCDHSVRLAREFGIGFTIARNSNHFGAAAYWGTRIAEQGQVGIVLCNASRLVAPWQGRDPRMGTNPICIAVPGPWLLDMSTTAVAANRIWAAIARNADSIPEEWALDLNGKPTSNPSAGINGSLAPLGGKVAGHKGSGLAAAVEILCAVLGGGPMAGEVGSMRQRGRRVGTSQSFLAIDIEHFMPLTEFAARLEQFVADLKSSVPAEGYEEVLVAGEPEWRTEQERLRSGIPISDEVWQALSKLSSELGVKAPVQNKQATRLG
jgi:LDH2 family malate/lactate/ureidoglycolate dehydrogenase